MSSAGGVPTADAETVPAGPPHELRRVLTLRDLVLGQVLIVVGTNWLGTGAKLGPSHHLFWLLGIALFHLPLAAVVIRLSRERPVEGGIYEWARAAYGETLGFLVGWNIWIFVVAYTSTLGLSSAQGILYARTALGTPGGGPDPALLHLALVVLLVALAVSGLRFGRWIHDGGAALQLVFFLLLVALAVGARGSVPRSGGEGPGSPLLALELFTKISVFGLAGLECLAALSGEARRPGQDLPRSVMVAVPIIALFYLGGTDALRTIVPAAEVDLVNPVAQAFSRRAGATWGGAAIAALLLRDVAAASIAFTAITRLPMVAGWNHVLPGWFARLDRRQVPVRSILFAGAATWALGFVGGLGVGLGEAYQLLQSAAGLFFAATYLCLFGIPLLARRGFSPPPLWLRLAAASGFVVTLLFMVLAVVPVVEVASALKFGLRVAGVFVGAQVLGLALLLAGKRSARSL